MNFFIFLTCIATIVIAFYAWKSHELAQRIKEESDKEIKKYQELMTALIASNVMQCFQHGQTPEGNLTSFKNTLPKIKEKLNV